LNWHPERSSKLLLVLASNHSWFRASSGLLTKFLFVPTPLMRLEMGLRWSFSVSTIFVAQWLYPSESAMIQGGSNMTGTDYIHCLHTNQSRSYLNHLVYGPLIFNLIL
jgi:hypothetical protein